MSRKTLATETEIGLDYSGYSREDLLRRIIVLENKLERAEQMWARWQNDYHNDWKRSWSHVLGKQGEGA